MGKSNPYSPKLNAGELTPRLAGRTDFAKYPQGLETCENLIPLAEGGLMRRPATRYVAELASSSVKGRLKPFQFSTTQAYMTELGDGVMRFFRHQGQIIGGVTSASITNGDFPTNINNWTDRSTGSGAISHDAGNGRMTLTPGGIGTTDIGWAEQVVTNTAAVEHVLKFKVIGAPSDRIQLRVGTASVGTQLVDDKTFEVGYHCYAFTATAADFYVQFRNIGEFRNKVVQIDDVSLIGTSAAVEIDTPWSESELFEVNGPQSADTMYLYHPDNPTHKLLRLGHTSWSLVEVAWEDGPYLAQNSTETTLTPASDTGLGVNFTLSAVTGVNNDQGWLSTDVGRTIRFLRGKSGPWGHAVITSITSSLIVVADIRTDDKLGQVWQVDNNPADNAYVDMTVEANSATDADLVPFPAADLSGDYMAIGFIDKYEKIIFDYANGTAGIGGNVAWEYWDGSAWSSLSGVTDNTTSFKAAAADGLTVSWPLPIDWAKRTIHTSSSLYYARAKITGNYSTNPVLDQAFIRVQATPLAVEEFRLGAWSGTTGYPSVGTFYEQRQFAANTTGQPQTIWATQTADFENHRPDDRSGTVEDDDALDYTISADEVNAIRWLSPGEDTLVLGTTGGEWIPESAGTVLTPSDLVIRRRTKHGSANIQPVRVGNVVLFVQTAKRKIRELGRSFEVEGYRAVDMTRLAQHVTRGGIVEMAFQQEPDSLIWAVRSDGQLLSMTFRREEDVVAWARHIIGGSFSSGDPVVESVAVIPGADGAGQTKSSENRDEVWITVKRTINSVTKRYVEVLERDFETGDDEEDAYYADSIITYDGAPSSAMSGLDHLEGETIKILADGFIHPDKTVSAGAITLDDDASVVQMGLGYTHTVKPLKFEGGTAVGTAVGKTKQIFGVTFILLNSHTLSFGPDASNLRAIDFREVPDPMDTAVPFFTGEHFEEFDDDWKTDPRIVIQSADPTPFNLLALAPEIEIHETK